MLSEVALAGGFVLGFLGSLLHGIFVLLGMMMTGAALVIGLILFLIFLGMVSSALNGRLIPGRIINFVIWGVLAFVGSGGAVVGYGFFLRYILSEPITANTPTILQAGGFGTAALIACLGLTVVVKYLGLYNVARDEIRKRVGRLRAA
jgi:hypothetical protein